jgi:hypothetical protein
MGRRAWLVGRIAALMAIVITGTLAIVHYASIGQVLASNPNAEVPLSASASIAARTARRHVGGGTPRVHYAPPDQSQAPGPSPTPTTVTVSVSPTASTSTTPSPAPPAQSQTPSTSASPTTPPAHGIVFQTLPPGDTLPTGAECARWVREGAWPENKAANQPYNQTVGQRVGAHFFPAGDTAQADAMLAPRINGDFTGTTADILRWAACKWGISQNVVFAQAAVASWWQQDTLGDWGTDAHACPPGHKLGADGIPGQCPQSFGVLQDRYYPYERSSWPSIANSTAMSTDTAYAIWRSCYDGYEPWLNTVPHGQPYHRGDLWGCVGRWFAGRWYTASADHYIGQVKLYLHQRIWLDKDFQQG